MWLKKIFCLIIFLIFVPRVIKYNDSLQPFTFKRFITTVKKIGQPDMPVPPLDSVSFHGCLSPVVPGFEMPSVDEFGMSDEDFIDGPNIWKGGENEALKRLDLLVEKVGMIQMNSDDSFLLWK